MGLSVLVVNMRVVTALTRWGCREGGVRAGERLAHGRRGRGLGVVVGLFLITRPQRAWEALALWGEDQAARSHTVSVPRGHSIAPWEGKGLPSTPGAGGVVRGVVRVVLGFV